MGGARTALFNYFYAKGQGGQYVLRIEDTDKERNREEWTTNLIEDLSWLGMKYDLFAKQSERTDLYVEALNKLIEAGYAYEAEESEKGEANSSDGKRPRVVRFKNPNKKITFQDVIRGEISIDTTDLGDFVIARGLNEPLFHMAVVVDDAKMGITHVIRAEEHLSNTPRQILLLEALGYNRPIYAHLPLVLAEDKSKLSKRKHGETVSLSYYKEKGYLPEAIVNFLALLGWNPGDEREIFSMEELIKEFKLEKVQKGGAIFNIQKLNSINAHYIKTLSSDEFKEKILGEVPEEVRALEGFSEVKLEQIIPLVQERVANTEEARSELAELSFFFRKPLYEATKLAWKDTHTDKVKTHLDVIINSLTGLDNNDFNNLSIKDKVWDYADKEGRGEVLWPMRFALSGKEKSPDPFTIAEILGKDETITRLKEALEKI
jgi:glutamyl-tRNA synthetase